MPDSLLFLILLIAAIILAPVAAPIFVLVSMVVSPRIKTIQATFRDWFARFLFCFCIIACAMEQTLSRFSDLPLWYDPAQKRRWAPSWRIESWRGRLLLGILGGMGGVVLAFFVDTYVVEPRIFPTELRSVALTLTLVFGYFVGSALILLWREWQDWRRSRCS